MRRRSFRGCGRPTAWRLRPLPAVRPQVRHCRPSSSRGGLASSGRFRSARLRRCPLRTSLCGIVPLFRTLPLLGRPCHYLAPGFAHGHSYCGTAGRSASGPADEDRLEVELARLVCGFVLDYLLRGSSPATRSPPAIPSPGPVSIRAQTGRLDHFEIVLDRRSPCCPGPLGDGSRSSSLPTSSKWSPRGGLIQDVQGLFASVGPRPSRRQA